MTATLEQTQSDLLRLVNLVRQGEEVVITNQGQPVAKLTPLPQPEPSPDRQAWLETLRHLQEQTLPDKTRPTTEEILEDLRSERG